MAAAFPGRMHLGYLAAANSTAHTMQTVRSLGALRRPHFVSKLPFKQVRRFHPTRPAPFLEVASGFVHGVHSLTGLPWAYSLPLTAVIVRLFVAMPLQIYTKKQARKERDLVPLLQSWKVFYKNQIKKNSLSSDSAPISEIMPILSKQVTDKRRELYKNWKVARFYKFANLLQLPVWLSVMESIRNMCGDDRGLLRFVGSVIRNWFHPGEAFKAIPLEAEPSLATEGAFWFPDLLAGDPTGALPALLTASIILNIRTGWKTMSLRETADLPRPEMILKLFPIFLKGLMNTLAVYIGCSAWAGGLPSALIVYWVTSTNVATLQTVFLDKYMFSKPPLKPWRQIHVGFRRAKNQERGKHHLA